MSKVNERPVLTWREMQVALVVAEGKTCEEIGRQLKLAFETVRSHVAGLRDKTGLRRKAQLAVWAANSKPWLATQMQTAKPPTAVPRRKRKSKKGACV